MIFHSLNFLLLSKRGGLFLKYHFGAVIVFALLYWLQDLFMSSYVKLGRKLGLGKTHPPADSIGYWLWFSALTQTTIGYGGPTTAKGAPISFNQMENRIFKLLNFIQICSVFIITAKLL